MFVWYYLRALEIAVSWRYFFANDFAFAQVRVKA